MEGGFQTDKDVEWEEELRLVVLPDLETLEITNPELPMGVRVRYEASSSCAVGQRFGPSASPLGRRLAQSHKYRMLIVISIRS